MPVPFTGQSCSLLVEGTRVFVASCGQVGALSAVDGRILWRPPFNNEGRGFTAVAVQNAAVQATEL